MDPVWYGCNMYLTKIRMRTPELLDSHSDSIIQKQTTNMLFKLLEKKNSLHSILFFNIQS